MDTRLCSLGIVFALDVDEMSVEKIRPLIANGTITVKPYSAPADPKAVCTFDVSSDHDLLPLNCIDRDSAAAACAAFGRELPTEAEWEYAASGAAESLGEATYPWGEDPAICDHAIVAVGDDYIGDDDSCRLKDQIVPIGVRVGGSKKDMTPHGILNLGGNVQEWVRDDFSAYGGTCWVGGLLEDPECQTVEAVAAVVRGGSWKSERTYSRVASRSAADPVTRDPGIGFRCAKRF